MKVSRSFSDLLFACWLGLALALAAAPAARAQEEPVAGRIGATIAGIEWLRGRAARCEARLPQLERRIAAAELEPTADAALLSTLYERRDGLKRCLVSVPARIARDETSLADLAAQFRDLTQIGAADLDARLAMLHEREAVHAQRLYTLRQAQLGLAGLQAADPPDPTRIAQKEAVVRSAAADLEVAVAAVAEANRALADLEEELALANRTGSARLNWVTPTTRANGAPLATGELGGFEIYVLSESTGENAVITVEDPLATSYEIGQLTPDTYHFSIAAFDTEGKFSQLSDIVSKLVP